MHNYKKKFGQHFLYDKNIIQKIILKLQPKNNDYFIEIGPGKVLSGMVKRTLKNINCFSINSIDDMKKTTDEFKK